MFINILYVIIQNNFVKNDLLIMCINTSQCPDLHMMVFVQLLNIMNIKTFLIIFATHVRMIHAML